MLAWATLSFHPLLVAHPLQVAHSKGGCCTVRAGDTHTLQNPSPLGWVQAKSHLYPVHQDKCLIKGAESMLRQDRSPPFSMQSMSTRWCTCCKSWHITCLPSPFSLLFTLCFWFGWKCVKFLPNGKKEAIYLQDVTGFTDVHFDISLSDVISFSPASCIFIWGMP